MNTKPFDKICLLYALLGAFLLSALHIMYGVNQDSFGTLAIFAIGGFFSASVLERSNSELRSNWKMMKVWYLLNRNHLAWDVVMIAIASSCTSYAFYMHLTNI